MLARTRICDASVTVCRVRCFFHLLPYRPRTHVPSTPGFGSRVCSVALFRARVSSRSPLSFDVRAPFADVHHQREGVCDTTHTFSHTFRFAIARVITRFGRLTRWSTRRLPSRTRSVRSASGRLASVRASEYPRRGRDSTCVSFRQRAHTN